MDREPLVSISEASRILGVSEATLRQWTDEGEVKAFITPGGHRRYSRVDLRKLTSPQQKIIGVRDLVSELEDTAQEHREIGRSSLAGAAWFSRLSVESQEQLGNLGRRLLRLIERHVTEPSRRGQIIRQAHDVGREHGETLARLGLGLTESVEAFILHRDPIVRATTQLTKQQAALNRRAVEATLMVHQVMDEALVSLVAAHQEYRTGAGQRVQRR